MSQRPFFLESSMRDAALRRHPDTSPEQIQAHDEHEKVWHNLRHGGAEETQQTLQEHSSHHYGKKCTP